jgi:hypothetical protein
MPPPTLDPLFIINRVIDGIFVFDVIFQFFIMVPLNNGGDGRTQWEMRLAVIARRYVHGWFSLDIVSIVPSLFDVLPLVLSNKRPNQTGTMALRALRGLRLIKLLRLMRVSRTFQVAAAQPHRHTVTLPYRRTIAPSHRRTATQTRPLRYSHVSPTTMSRHHSPTSPVGHPLCAAVQGAHLMVEYHAHHSQARGAHM